MGAEARGAACGLVPGRPSPNYDNIGHAGVARDLSYVVSGLAWAGGLSDLFRVGHLDLRLRGSGDGSSA